MTKSFVYLFVFQVGIARFFAALHQGNKNNHISAEILYRKVGRKKTFDMDNPKLNPTYPASEAIMISVRASIRYGEYMQQFTLLRKGCAIEQ